MILAVLKLGCVLTYLAGLAATAGLLSGDVGRVAQLVALGMLALHAVELPFALPHLRRHAASLGTSVLLTLVFGVLYWKPLASARPAR